MAIEFDRGAADFPCPRCKTRIVCSKQETNHRVSVSNGKATVSPAWCCPNCYLVGQLKRGRFSVAGDLSDSEGNARAHVPIGTRVATTRHGVKVRNAIKIEQSARRPSTKSEGATEEPAPGDQDTDFSEEDDPIEPDDLPEQERRQTCPKKPQHGPMSQQGYDMCPICETKFKSWYEKQEEGEEDGEDEAEEGSEEPEGEEGEE